MNSPHATNHSTRVHSRRTATSPLGNDAIPWVRAGNDMMLLTALMSFMVWTAGSDFVIEAPIGSVFGKVTFMKQLFLLSNSDRHIAWLGHYGAKTFLPQLVTSFSWCVAG